MFILDTKTMAKLSSYGKLSKAECANWWASVEQDTKRMPYITCIRTDCILSRYCEFRQYGLRMQHSDEGLSDRCEPFDLLPVLPNPAYAMRP